MHRCIFFDNDHKAAIGTSPQTFFVLDTVTEYRSSSCFLVVSVKMCRICGRVVKCIFDTMPSRVHHVPSRR